MEAFKTFYIIICFAIAALNFFYARYERKMGLDDYYSLYGISAGFVMFGVILILM